MNDSDKLRREIDRYKGLAHAHSTDAAYWERRFRDERAARQDADEKAAEATECARDWMATADSWQEAAEYWEERAREIEKKFSDLAWRTSGL